MSKDSKVIIEARDIALAYDGKTIISNLNFDVYEEEFVSIIGPSGIGKSTLLNCLAGLLPLDHGRVLLHGKEKSPQGYFSYMQQDDLLIPWLSVFDNVSLYQKIHKEKMEGDVRSKLMHDLESFGLGDYAFALPEELSGGMRQRAAFLRTVQSPAPILLLDEPFAASDAITRSSLQDWLLDLRKNLRRTILLVTHDLDEAIYLSNRIIVLGFTPAKVRAEEFPNCPIEKRDRAWLYQQSALKARLYSMLTDSKESEGNETSTN